MMKIMITGATGMVGQALVNSLVKDYHLFLVGRDKSKLSKMFSYPHLNILAWDDLNDFNQSVDVIVHLAGKNIGDFIWTQKNKEAILRSRVDTSKQLINWIQKFNFKPRILVANAVGFYGCYPHTLGFSFDEERIVDETKPTCFLQQVAFDWQNVWKGTNLDVCAMRFGVVLQKNKGMLKKLYPSFIFGLGAILGTGKQQISWIHIDDLIRAITLLLDYPKHCGAINMTSPYPVTQAEFAAIFAKSLHRPLWFKMPAWFVRLIFGQMGTELLLNGQEVYPRKLLSAGFEFKLPQLEEALDYEY